MKNVIVAIFRQNLSNVNKKGELIEFNAEQKFMGETAQAMSANHVGLWLLGQLKHFMKLQRLQGKTGFKLSKPIELTLMVNNKTEKFGFKFSLSLERIERLIEKTPELVQAAFVPARTPSQVVQSLESAKNYLLDRVSPIICKAIAPKREVVMIEEMVGE